MPLIIVPTRPFCNALLYHHTCCYVVKSVPSVCIGRSSLALNIKASTEFAIPLRIPKVLIRISARRTDIMSGNVRGVSSTPPAKCEDNAVNWAAGSFLALTQ
jgi:hypothetical protein